MTMDYYSSPAASLILVHALHRSTSVRTMPRRLISTAPAFHLPAKPRMIRPLNTRFINSTAFAICSRAVSNRRFLLPGLKQST
jgi:hypothetical protein